MTSNNPITTEIMRMLTAQGASFKDISIHCYPVEFIFAEKLETVVFRGRDNSRMKDFHDLYTLTRQAHEISKADLINAIRSVFNHRNTPFDLPIKFDKEILGSLQIYWQRYRQMSAFPSLLPSEIWEIVQAINHWLCNIN